MCHTVTEKKQIEQYVKRKKKKYKITIVSDVNKRKKRKYVIFIE